MMNPEVSDPFADLKRRATERADRTVERLRAGIAALQANGQKITAESIKQITRDLEPGFAGLSFKVVRRNASAYALYRDAADAFSTKPALKGGNSREVDAGLECRANNPARHMTPCSASTNGIWCGAFEHWRVNWMQSGVSVVLWPTISRCARQTVAARD